MAVLFSQSPSLADIWLTDRAGKQVSAPILTKISPEEEAEELAQGVEGWSAGRDHRHAVGHARSPWPESRSDRNIFRIGGRLWQHHRPVFNGQQGPVMALGEPGGPQVLIAAPSGFSSEVPALLTVTGGVVSVTTVGRPGPGRSRPGDVKL